MIQKTEESLIVHICTWLLATRKAWKGRRHARNQIAMKLNAARANISGIFLSKLKIPALVASRFTLILLTENVNVYTWNANAKLINSKYNLQFLCKSK